APVEASRTESENRQGREKGSKRYGSGEESANGSWNDDREVKFGRVPGGGTVRRDDEAPESRDVGDRGPQREDRDPNRSDGRSEKRRRRRKRRRERRGDRDGGEPEGDRDTSRGDRDSSREVNDSRPATLDGPKVEVAG